MLFKKIIVPLESAKKILKSVKERYQFALELKKQSSTFNEIFDMKISNYLPAIENFRYNVDKCAAIMQIRISEEFSLTECKQQEVSVELYYQ
ncbi:unnamed protein product [Rhizophagus irregularis]|nr:unnamed protein product [Rhizophagus irregularis]